MELSTNYTHETAFDAVKEGIKSAFKKLRKQGYFCRCTFKCCQSCGWASVPEGKGDKVVFFHRQDASSAKQDRNGGVFLAWSGDAAEICKAMLAEGLHVEHDGSEFRRIKVAIRP